MTEEEGPPKRSQTPAASIASMPAVPAASHHGARGTDGPGPGPGAARRSKRKALKAQRQRAKGVLFYIAGNRIDPIGLDRA